MTTPSPERAPTEPSALSLVQTIIASCGQSGACKSEPCSCAIDIDRFRAAGVREGIEACAKGHDLSVASCRKAAEAQRRIDPDVARENLWRAEFHEVAARNMRAIASELPQECDEARRSAEALERHYDELQFLLDNPPAPTDKLRELLTTPSPWDATQPTTDDVERAREVISEWLEHDLTSWLDTELAELRELIAAALTAARREERELRSLDEAVIEAGRAVDAAWIAFSEHGNHDARLITALYARLDDFNVALAARDAAQNA